jgi:hypothetical protein
MTTINEALKNRKEVAKERLECCKGCEDYNPVTTQCNQCGCFMLLKTLLMDSNCPINKWSAYTGEVKQ